MPLLHGEMTFENNDTVPNLRRRIFSYIYNARSNEKVSAAHSSGDGLCMHNQSWGPSVIL